MAVPSWLTAAFFLAIHINVAVQDDSFPPEYSKLLYDILLCFSISLFTVLVRIPLASTIFTSPGALEVNKKK